MSKFGKIPHFNQSVGLPGGVPSQQQLQWMEHGVVGRFGRDAAPLVVGGNERGSVAASRLKKRENPVMETHLKLRIAG